MLNRILIVCVGNICRSPIAEHLLRESLHGTDIAVGSAGLGALRGHSTDSAALAILHRHGHRPQPHHARQLTVELLHEANLVLVMEQSQIQSVIRLAPEARGKTFLLGKWQADQEIPDPYRKGPEAFELAYELIAASVAAWAARIRNRR
ncbi:low molecular weight phosphotyrosine protein phosphatase [Pseudomonas sp. PDNC002]|uniref:low molecular weight protein-tyrosine-phosphatase n=1 Tax=Pseudomonas sp. PDNC002 TaxID=2811422 RepID=UPI00196367E9|nr:low molecular weight protein-tyrosine-phosphatase [Pseudomonas sp. PDNC002]QRY81988.1 low molecular weight phosphotyrosine protein phosphatase [Pseudomonas sp. PDNC002]